MRKQFKLTKVDEAVIDAVSHVGAFTRLNFSNVGKKEPTKHVPAPEEENCRYYEFIANSNTNVMHDMIQVGKLLGIPLRGNDYRMMNRPKFLDVGSGTGNILSLANAAGFNPYGVEYDKEYQKISSYHTKNRTIYKDALKFEAYGEYEIVYFYQPIITTSVMCKLLDIIDSQIKKGTIIMCYPADMEVERKVDALWARVFKGKRNVHIKK